MYIPFVLVSMVIAGHIIPPPGCTRVIWSYQSSEPPGMIALLLIIVAWQQDFKSCVSVYSQDNLEYLPKHALTLYRRYRLVSPCGYYGDMKLHGNKVFVGRFDVCVYV